MEDHVRLFIPGPIEVRKEILDAQAAWMIGHRSSEFAELYARLQPKLMKSFGRETGRVFVYTSSGTGVWESASRNCIRDGRRVLHLVNGAFSERWADVSQLNGKSIDKIEVPWGQAVKPEQLADALHNQSYDAVACVYNETSTGVLQPISAYAEIMRHYPSTLFLVDVVSAYLGAEVQAEAWGIDVCLTSSQKAMALPPGIAFGAISDRTLERAKQVTNRGYYFDMIELEKTHQKNNTPTTPPISLMFAADKQLDDILAEGIENRVARHHHMAAMTREWVARNGFEMFSEEGYHSPTVSTVRNTRGIDISAMNKFLRQNYKMVISSGYGKIKAETFRIAHMGDIQPEHMQALFAAMDDFLARE
jgi:predicted phosphoserine aminotransferase